MFLVNHSKHPWPSFLREDCKEKISYSCLWLLIRRSAGSLRDKMPDDTSDQSGLSRDVIAGDRRAIEQGLKSVNVGPIEIGNISGQLR
jgi:hypothetical protein